MTDHTVWLQRSHNAEGWLSAQSIATDALNGILSIPGVEGPAIISETEHSIEISYRWIGKEKFWQTDEYLKRFGVCRADWPCAGGA